MSSILTRLLEKGLPTRDVQIATTGEQQQRPIKFEGAQDGNLYNGDLLVVGGQDDQGFARHINLDSQGRVIIAGQSTGVPVPVVIQGQYADGSGLATNPVVMAGRYNATPRVLQDGDLGAVALNSEGKMMIDLQNASLTATVNVDIDQSTDSIQLYANDGTSNRAVRSDASGRLLMVGAVADGAMASGNPVIIGGVDASGLVHQTRTDTSGNAAVVGASAFQAPVAGNPVTMGVVSPTGTNLYAVGDTEGHLIVDTRGYDNGTWRNVRADANGSLIISSGTAVGDSAEVFVPFIQGVIVEGAGTVQSAISDAAGRQIIVGAAPNGTAVAGNPVLIAGEDESGNVSILNVDAAGSVLVSTTQTENAVSNGSLFALAGQYNATPRTITDGRMGAVAVDENGHLLVDLTVSYTTSSMQMYGTDGVVLQPLLTDTSGRCIVAGSGASGSLTTGNPVLIGGTDGTNTRNLLTDTTGRVIMVGTSANGVAVSGNPVLNAGSDGTNTRTLSTDTAGRQLMVGAVAEMASVAGNPLLVGASTDTGKAAYIRSDNTGVLYARVQGEDDFGVVHPIRQDNNGTALVGGGLANGSDLNDVAVNPVLTAGADNTGIIHNTRVTTEGYTIVAGAVDAGTTATSAPVLQAGVDGTNNVRSVRTDTTGIVQVRMDAPLCTTLRATNPATATPQLLFTPGSATYASAAAFTPLLNAQFFNVTSDSIVNSFSLNTGCTQVTLSGVDENNTFVTETIHLNGTTPVSTVNKYFAFYDISAYDLLDGTSYIYVRPAAGDVDYAYISNSASYIPILYCPVGYVLRVTAISIHTDALAKFSLQGYKRLPGKLSGVNTYWRNLYVQAYNMDFGVRGAAILDGGEYMFVANESSTNNTSADSTLVSLYVEYRTSI